MTQPRPHLTLVIAVLSRAYLIALTFCTLTTLYVLFDATVPPGRFDTMIHSRSYVFRDFAQYYACGKILLSNDRTRAYDYQVDNHFLEDISGFGNYTKNQQLEFPPNSFVLTVPFALMPPLPAFIMWNVIQLGLAGVGVYLLCQWLNRSSADKWRAILILTGTLASAAASRALFMGQISLFVLAAASIFAWAYLRRQHVLAGLALFFALMKPQYAALIIPALARKRWKTLLVFCAVEVLFTALACLFMGWQTVLSYPFHISHQDETGVYQLNLVPTMINIRSLLSIFTAYSTAYRVSLCLYALGAIILFRTWCVVSDQETKLLAALIIFALVASPHTHLYDLVLLAIPAALTIPSFSPQSIWNTHSLPARLWTLVFLFYPILSWAVILHGNFGQLSLTAPLCLLNLVLLCCISLMIKEGIAKTAL